MSDTVPIKMRTRFAPSPTGHIHLGNVRTALFNVLLAKRDGGVFLLRIEDTDQERSQEEFLTALLHDMRWLGLQWDEGPQVGGIHGPYRQSERGGIYREYYDALERKGQAYPCFCSEQELKLSRKRQLSAGLPPRYSGTCANLTQKEIQQRLDQGKQPTLRFRVTRGQAVEFADLVRGQQKFLTDDIGDFIIRRADGTAAFFFCNAIDDAVMGVTHVLRGEDHLANTPRQILILQALGLLSPQYGHISMIVGNDGAPLSKRHGSRSLQQLNQEGFLPAALVNYLARLGHHFEESQLLSVEQLAARFDFNHLGRAPARYDEEQLLHWQREAIAQLDVDEFFRWAGSGIERLVPAGARAQFADAVRHNVVLPADAIYWAQVIFGEEHALDSDSVGILQSAGYDFFHWAVAVVESGIVDYAKLTQQLKEKTGVKGKALFHPLRVALTGKTDGPEMGKLLPLMSREQLQARFANAREIALHPRS